MENVEMTEEQLVQALKDKRAEKKKEIESKKKDYNERKDEYVSGVVDEMLILNSTLTNFKRVLVQTSSDLHSEMYAIFGKEEKKTKQFTLESSDGLKKIEVSRQDRYVFNETAEVHINTIKEVFKDKFSKRNKKIYKMLETILMKNKKGDYDEKLCVRLNKHKEDVDDPRFEQALDELNKCLIISGTSEYSRGFHRKDKESSWEHVNIQFSTL